MWKHEGVCFLVKKCQFVAALLHQIWHKHQNEADDVWKIYKEGKWSESSLSSASSGPVLGVMPCSRERQWPTTCSWGFSLPPLTVSPQWTERCDQLWAHADTTRRRCCISSVCSEQKPAEPTELHHQRFCSAAVNKSSPLMSCWGFNVCDADRRIGVDSAHRPAAWRASLEPDVRLF